MPKIPLKPANSKIRFIMLEADLADGDLTPFTNAISNALRPAPASRLLVNGKPSQPSSDNAAATLVEEPEPEYDADSEVATTSENERAPRRSTPRRLSTPTVVDVDLNSGDMPFETYAAQKQPSTDLNKHLVVASWFKAYRDTPTVTADHAYTCYRKMGWSTSIKVFAQPFRDLQRKGHGTMKDGNFAINHLGEDAVNKLATA